MAAVFLLDSSALINNERFAFLPESSYFMTSECFSELKSFSRRLLAENALKNNLLVIKNPSPQSVEKMLSFLKKIGDKKLSRADVSLLALALEFKEREKNFVIISDDFSVQNACKHLGILFEGSAQGNIKRAKKWG